MKNRTKVQKKKLRLFTTINNKKNNSFPRGLLLQRFLEFADIKFLSVRAADTKFGDIPQKEGDAYLDFPISDLTGIQIIEKLEEFPDYLDSNVVAFSEEPKIKKICLDAFVAPSKLYILYTIGWGEEDDYDFSLYLEAKNIVLVRPKFDAWLQTEEFKTQILPFVPPSFVEDLYRDWIWVNKSKES